ncbi:MAG TPA: tRNA (adenosine(37)-N6)-threonylcarbamoyltransferase complex ATPase subunit type 1 TsaE [Cytophagaceae bacterium]|jgi:tRNA threonylcarbamoyladenosine biosynthesis protein TsaE|nr:tRNA (adenosine(37)-N6)-threonylcarbamoyltransferase complex ATPase subunit type 1 TsaE [Cytophagaceae bacterium]
MVAETIHKEVVCKELNDLVRVSKEIIEFAGEEKIWLFEGQMGAGKTTLIKALCQELAVIDHVTSPSYSLINEYLTKDQRTIYHFDFYRIKDQSEAVDIGCEEYFYSENLCLIEWPSLIPDLLPDKYLMINIDIASPTQRNIQLSRYEN